MIPKSSYSQVDDDDDDDDSGPKRRDGSESGVNRSPVDLRSQMAGRAGFHREKRFSASSTSSGSGSENLDIETHQFGSKSDEKCVGKAGKRTDDSDEQFSPAIHSQPLAITPTPRKWNVEGSSSDFLLRGSLCSPGIQPTAIETEDWLHVEPSVLTDIARDVENIVDELCTTTRRDDQTGDLKSDLSVWQPTNEFLLDKILRKRTAKLDLPVQNRCLLTELLGFGKFSRESLEDCMLQHVAADRSYRRSLSAAMEPASSLKIMSRSRGWHRLLTTDSLMEPIIETGFDFADWIFRFIRVIRCVFEREREAPHVFGVLGICNDIAPIFEAVSQSLSVIASSSPRSGAKGQIFDMDSSDDEASGLPGAATEVKQAFGGIVMAGPTLARVSSLYRSSDHSSSMQDLLENLLIEICALCTLLARDDYDNQSRLGMSKGVSESLSFSLTQSLQSEPPNRRMLVHSLEAMVSMCKTATNTKIFGVDNHVCVQLMRLVKDGIHESVDQFYCRLSATESGLRGSTDGIRLSTDMILISPDKAMSEGTEESKDDASSRGLDSSNKLGDRRSDVSLLSAPHPIGQSPDEPVPYVTTLVTKLLWLLIRGNTQNSRLCESSELMQCLCEIIEVNARFQPLQFYVCNCFGLLGHKILNTYIYQPLPEPEAEKKVSETNTRKNVMNIGAAAGTSPQVPKHEPIQTPKKKGGWKALQLMRNMILPNDTKFKHLNDADASSLPPPANFPPADGLDSMAFDEPPPMAPPDEADMDDGKKSGQNWFANRKSKRIAKSNQQQVRPFSGAKLPKVNDLPPPSIGNEDLDNDDAILFSDDTADAAGGLKRIFSSNVPPPPLSSEKITHTALTEPSETTEAEIDEAIMFYNPHQRGLSIPFKSVQINAPKSKSEDVVKQSKAKLKWSERKRNLQCRMVDNLIRAIINHDEDAEVTETVLETMAKLACNVKIAQMLLDECAIPEVIKSMQRNARNRNILSSGLEVLLIMCENCPLSSLQVKTTSTGGNDLLQSVCLKFPNDLILIGKAVDVLESISRNCRVSSISGTANLSSVAKGSQFLSDASNARLSIVAISILDSVSTADNCNLLLSLFQRFLANRSMIIKLVSCVQSICAGHEDSIVQFTKCGICQMLRVIVAQFQMDSGFVKFVFGAVRALCFSSGCRDQLGNEGFCDLLGICMNAFCDIKSVQLSALSAMYKLAAFHPDNQKRLGKQSTIVAICDCLKHFSDDRDVVENCIGCIFVLGFEGSSRAVLGELEVYRDIIKYSPRFPTDSPIQYKAVGALYTMCLNHPTMRKKLGDAGACSVVLQTIVEFQDKDRRIVMTACDAIIQLSFDVDNAERFADNDIFNTMLRIIMIYEKDFEIAIRIIECCANLTFGNRKNSRLFGTQGGLRVVVNILKFPIQSKEDEDRIKNVKIKCLALINQIISWGPGGLGCDKPGLQSVDSGYGGLLSEDGSALNTSLIDLGVAATVSEAAFTLKKSRAVRFFACFDGHQAAEQAAWVVHALGQRGRIISAAFPSTSISATFSYYLDTYSQDQCVLNAVFEAISSLCAECEEVLGQFAEAGVILKICEILENSISQDLDVMRSALKTIYLMCRESPQNHKLLMGKTIHLSKLLSHVFETHRSSTHPETVEMMFGVLYLLCEFEEERKELMKLNLEAGIIAVVDDRYEDVRIQRMATRTMASIMQEDVMKIRLLNCGIVAVLHEVLLYHRTDEKVLRRGLRCVRRMATDALCLQVCLMERLHEPIICYLLIDNISEPRVVIDCIMTLFTMSWHPVLQIEIGREVIGPILSLLSNIRNRKDMNEQQLQDFVSNSLTLCWQLIRFEPVFLDNLIVEANGIVSKKWALRCKQGKAGYQRSSTLSQPELFTPKDTPAADSDLFREAADNPSRDIDGNILSMLENGIWYIVGSLMSSFAESKEVCSASASLCWLLASLAQSRSDFPDTVARDIIDALSRFATISDVADKFVAAVWWLCVDSDLNRRLLGEAGAIDAVCIAFVAHPTNVTLRAHCCAALWELSRFTPNAQILLRSGAVQPILIAGDLKQNGDNLMLSFFAYGVIRILEPLLVNDSKNVDLQQQISKWSVPVTQLLNVQEGEILSSTDNYEELFRQRSNAPVAVLCGPGGSGFAGDGRKRKKNQSITGFWHRNKLATEKSSKWKLPFRKDDAADQRLSEGMIHSSELLQEHGRSSMGGHSIPTRASADSKETGNDLKVPARKAFPRIRSGEIDVDLDEDFGEACNSSKTSEDSAPPVSKFSISTKKSESSDRSSGRKRESGRSGVCDECLNKI